MVWLGDLLHQCKHEKSPEKWKYLEVIHTLKRNERMLLPHLLLEDEIYRQS